MAMGAEYGVIRLRGTFLDIGPDRSRQVRRHSCPELQASVSDHSSWLDSLLERANNLSSHQSKDKRVHKHARASNYNTNGYDEPLTTYGHFDKDPVRNSSSVAEIINFEGERKVLPMGMMCQHSPMTADSHTATQSLESPVTTPSGADSSVGGETPAAADKITTLMISYIPERMKIEEFIDILHSRGFANTYDLLYMPFSTKPQGRVKNLGYMFVNFKKPEGAEAFTENFKDFRFPARMTRKLCTARPARCQGLEENMKMHNSGKGPRGWLGTVGEEGLTQWTWT